MTHRAWIPIGALILLMPAVCLAQGAADDTNLEFPEQGVSASNDMQQVEDLTLHDTAQKSLSRNGLMGQNSTFAYRGIMTAAKMDQIFLDNSYSHSPHVDGTFKVARSIVGTPFITFDPRGRFTNTEVTAGVGLTGSTPIGLNYDLRFTSSSIWTTQNSSTLSPFYQNRLAATITQPLWQGLGLEYNSKMSKMTRAEKKAFWAKADGLRSKLLVEVIRSYWTLWAALRNADMARTMVKWANSITQVLQRRMEQGRASRSRLIESQTLMAMFNDLVFQNEMAALQAEKALLFFIYTPEEHRIEGEPLLRALRPVDQPQLEAETRNVDDLLQVAFRKRGEIRELTHMVELFRLRAMVAENESKPKVDLSVSAGTASLVGASTYGIVPGHELVIKPPPDYTVGSYGDAWSRMFSEGLPFIEANLKAALPLHNGERTYKSKQAQANYEGTIVDLKSAHEDVAIQVRDTILRHRLMRSQLDSAQKGSAAAWDELSFLQRGFKGGEDNSEDLLEVLELWGRSRQGLSHIIVEYEGTYAELLASIGEVVDFVGVEIPDQDKPVE